MEKTENYLKILIMLFFANVRLILFFIGLFGGLSIMVAFFVPPVYHVSGTVIVKAKKIKPPPESTQERTTLRSILPPTIEDVRLETRVISNPDLIKSSVTQLIDEGVSFDHLTGTGSSFKEKYLPFLFGNRDFKSPELKIDLATQDILKKLKTEIIPGSNLISVEMNCHNPVLGAQVLNAIFDNYLKFRLNIFTDPSALDLFAAQAENYKATLEALEKNKLSLLRRYGISNVEDEITNQLNLIEVLKKELFQLEDSLLKENRKAVYLKKLIKEYLRDQASMYQPFPYDFGDEKIRGFSQQLDSLLIEYYKALKIYRQDTPKIQLMEDQLRKFWHKMITLVQTHVKLKADEIETLKQIIAGKKAKINLLVDRNQQIAEGGFELDRINTQIRLNQENYEAFLRKYEESRIEQTSEVTQKSNVQILSRAAVPVDPVFPKKSMVIAIGLLTGFILGFSLAFIKEFFDHTFKAPWQVQQYLNLPVIGSVPHSPKLRSKE